MLEIDERTASLDGQPARWLTAPCEGSPILWIHGVPESADAWRPFLQRCGGIAVDLPGFGRAGKRADLDYSIAGYATFLERFTEHLGIDRLRLVMHDWGAVGMAFAQAHPERVERLVLMDAVPFLPGYRWHRVARMWRTRWLGETVMGATTRFSMRQGTREANVAPGPLPDEWVDQTWRHFDQGTQRAILRLYRSADPDVLEAAGRRLGDIPAPALVVWGDHDPYLPTRFAHEYAERIPNGRALVVPDAGHWPWLDKPGLIGEVCAFLNEA